MADTNNIYINDGLSNVEMENLNDYNALIFTANNIGQIKLKNTIEKIATTITRDKLETLNEETISKIQTDISTLNNTLNNLPKIYSGENLPQGDDLDNYKSGDIFCLIIPE